MMAWYNSPLWAWRLDDELEELKSSSSSSRADDQRQDKEIERTSCWHWRKFWPIRVCCLRRRSLQR